MLKHTTITQRRIQKVIERMATQIRTEKVPVDVVGAGPVGRISRGEAQKLKYKPMKPGQSLLPGWSTWWFRVKGTVPAAWRSGQVELLFNTRSEAQVWIDGNPYQGLNFDTGHPYGDQGRVHALLPGAMVKKGRVELEVEAAANGLFGVPSSSGGYTNVNESGLFTFSEAALVKRDEEAWDLYHDLFVPGELVRLIADPKKMTPWQGYLLARMNDLCNVLIPEDRSTWKAAAPILKAIRKHKNASYTHELSAVGHAHIDTGWLWPVAETVRKCARTFSTATTYMERYPRYRFAVSQAVQYEMMKEKYPGLYARIKAAVKRGQFMPVGGTWVEPDCNIPSGESLVRQFLYGQRFFQKEFGITCTEFWNPDVFGYSGALPQIMKACGIERFVTQKLSWNQFNKPTHMNFYWEGIDGTRVLTHFPPADTYNAMAGHRAVGDLLHHVENYADNDRTKEALLLYGYGDGGGGPTEHMLEVLDRAADFQGLPKVTQRPVPAFFDRLEKDLTDVPVVSGELYFELHRGTYTSQGRTKRGNRKSEVALRTAEFLHALGNRGRYPQEALEALWKLTLLNQFHDILPGSSITEVYDVAHRDYAQIEKETRVLIESGARAWGLEKGISVINTASWDRAAWVSDPALDKAGIPAVQKTEDGQGLHFVKVPALGAAGVDGMKAPRDKVQAASKGAGFRLENESLILDVNGRGEFTRLFHKDTGREALAEGETGNRLVVFDDRPNHWDAWDMDAFHLETRKLVEGKTSARLVEKGPARATIQVTCAFGDSTYSQRISVEAGSPVVRIEGEADWHHRHTFLKVEFPVTVKSDVATYEIQHGVVTRPTHFNTPYDVARFESSAHRFIDLSEPGFGVSLLNDCKYGFAVHGSTMRISLLRSPTSPDAEADQGRHTFAYGIYPHGGDWREARTVRLAHDFNHPLVVTPVQAAPGSRFKVQCDHVVLDAVKKAEDDSNLVLRFYEAHGQRGMVGLTLPEGVTAVSRTNALEQEEAKLKVDGDRVQFPVKPFELITLKLYMAGTAKRR